MTDQDRSQAQWLAIGFEQIDRYYAAQQARFSGRPYLPTPAPASIPCPSR